MLQRGKLCQQQHKGSINVDISTHLDSEFCMPVRPEL